MRRFVILWLATWTCAATAQNRDVVYFLERSSQSERVAAVEGSIVEDSVNGVRIKPTTGPEKTIRATEIVDVAYTIPRNLETKFQTIVLAESAVRQGTADRARLEQLIKDYGTVLEQLRDPKLGTLRRHVNYRLAVLKAQLAEKSDELSEAAANLGKLRTESLENWHLVPAVLLQAQLLVELGRIDDAANVLDSLSRTPKLIPEIKREIRLQVMDLLLRSQQPREVEGRATDELAELPADHPLVPVLKLYQLAAQNWRSDVNQTASRLKEIIAQAENLDLKAIGYNLLGHLYSSKERWEDAMWSYLWVDVVYNQDRREQLKAIERLAKVFAELQDETRAEKYRERLRSNRLGG